MLVVVVLGIQKKETITILDDCSYLSFNVRDPAMQTGLNDTQIQ
jgi:hypothetical protein